MSCDLPLANWPFSLSERVHIQRSWPQTLRDFCCKAACVSSNSFTTSVASVILQPRIRLCLRPYFKAQKLHEVMRILLQLAHTALQFLARRLLRRAHAIQRGLTAACEIKLGPGAMCLSKNEAPRASKTWKRAIFGPF